MIINNVHCMFEQSGTFKNEFKKLGYQAYDYDILNNFNETDFVIDLFNEIDLAYQGKPSIFDNINKADLIIAFFPCVRFESQILLWFLGNEYHLINKTLKEKLEIDIKLHNELNYYYTIISKLVCICIDRDFKLIIENPYSTQHYLVRYWAFKPTIIDYDRRKTGDYLKKPTQFWFLNCEPSYNFIFECVDIKPKKRIVNLSFVDRSMISEDYANRFIREFVL